VSVHVANLTVVVRLRGAECRLPVFHTEKQRNYQGNSLGKTLQRRFHLPGSTATRSPLTVWKINTSYAIAAWMIGQTKWVIPSLTLQNPDLTRKTVSLFHC